MGFQSILGVNQPLEIKPEDIDMPKYFYDLNLDQVVQDIMQHQKLYDIRRYYFEKASIEDIRYRLEVMQDMDNDRIYNSCVDFALGMRTARNYLANINTTKIASQKHKWKLDAAFQYINTVKRFYEELKVEQVTSQGFTLLKEWLRDYIDQEMFCQLQTDTMNLTEQFQKMKYNIQIKRDRIIVEEGSVEDNYCREIHEMFGIITEDNFYQANPFATVTLSKLEEKVLEVLKKSFKKSFQELEEYNRKWNEFTHPLLAEFEVEVQFYIAFRQYRDEMKLMNYHFCYPKFHETRFEIIKGYDLALARVNAEKKKEVIFNDCFINEGERFLVVTGPNQGGKTTYARSLGQILYFGSIGLMVPAESACFPAFDGIYTHFAAEESMETGSGKLKEELTRLKNMMDHVTKHSFVIINEIFTSATSYDANIMGKRAIDYFMKADCMGVYVTHIHELTKGDDRIVSMVATLLSEDSNVRTFKIERRAADGKSYANSIVEKYHMTFNEIKERISGEGMLII